MVFDECGVLAAQYIGIDFQKPYLESHIDVANGSMKSYPSNGINFASAGSGVFPQTNKAEVIYNYKIARSIIICFIFCIYILIRTRKPQVHSIKLLLLLFFSTATQIIISNHNTKLFNQPRKYIGNLLARVGIDLFNLFS